MRELLGPRDLTYAETAAILGARIGHPGLPYVQMPGADMAAALVEAGLSPSFAGLYVEMTEAFNRGLVRPRAGRTAENSTPTTFEQFADELSPSSLVLRPSILGQGTTLSIPGLAVRHWGDGHS